MKRVADVKTPATDILRRKVHEVLWSVTACQKSVRGVTPLATVVYAYFLQKTSRPPTICRRFRENQDIHSAGAESCFRVRNTLGTIHTKGPCVAYINKDIPHSTLTPCAGPGVHHPYGKRVFTVQYGLCKWTGRNMEGNPEHRMIPEVTRFPHGYQEAVSVPFLLPC